MSYAAKLLESATTHHQAGRMAEAERAYRKLLKVEAAHKDGLRLLGALYLQSGQIPRAVECLERAARLLAGDPETLTNFGIALKAAGRREDALAAYGQALKINPDHIPALNNRAAFYQETGKVREAMEDYAHILHLLPNNPAAHFNYANVLCAAGRGREATARYEHALKLKPDYLEAMINLGMVLCQIGQMEQSQKWLNIAQEWFEKALKSDPANIVALNNLGNVLRQKGDADGALSCYREALRIRPTYGQAALNMATCLRDLNRQDEAMQSCRAAVKLMPESADARINLGTFLQDLSRHEEAVTVFDEALKLNPSSIDAKWNKSLSLLSLGKYREGWALHEAGLGVMHMRGEYPTEKKRWNGEDLTGKRLLIWCEQGLGDSLQFVRYAELCKARGGEILFLCPRPLRSLFSHCAFIDALPDSITEHEFDFHIPAMSLPFALGTTVETIPANIPYLKIGDGARARWAGKFTEKKTLRVGLVWAGNPRENQIAAHMTDKKRSISLDMLRPLFDVENVEFYNLQMGAGAAQIDEYGLRDRIIDVMGGVLDFEDTGAILEYLDLVISVDTSVAHLAGGMGKPVWVLSRYDACWRWLQNRPDSPWYPTARVFGQKAPGDWVGVVQSLKSQLEKLRKTR